MRLGRWRRRKARTPASTRDTERFQEPERGPTILLERLDRAQGEEIIAALGKRYELAQPGADVVEVLVDDAVYPDEAVVRLASIMDEIDPGWQAVISWPKVKP